VDKKRPRSLLRGVARRHCLDGRENRPNHTETTYVANRKYVCGKLDAVAAIQLFSDRTGAKRLGGGRGFRGIETDAVRTHGAMFSAVRYDELVSHSTEDSAKVWAFVR
jgi:hypothetical protein